MGNITCEPKKKTMTMQNLTTKIGEYRTIHERDPEMIEDPDFPQKMMQEALNNNNTIEGSSIQGTYVYYPNKRKPKMWIGNYKILNPEDILCKNVAEKMGMTETEWKNCIENKKKTQGEPRKTENYMDPYDPSDQQSREINETMKKSNVDHPLDINEYSPYYNKEQNTKNLPYVSNHHNIEHNHDIPQYYPSNEEIKNGFVVDEKTYCNKENTEKDKIIQDRYINRLNEEVTKIREELEKSIHEKYKDIYSYSRTNDSQIIIPQKNGSYILQNIDSTKIDNDNDYTLRELINEKKNQMNSQNFSSEYKNKNEEHTNLSSMCTKESLGLNNSYNDQNISNENIYLNRNMVK